MIYIQLLSINVRYETHPLYHYQLRNVIANMQSEHACRTRAISDGLTGVKGLHTVLNNNSINVHP